ncbi:MAG: VOC family protein [Marivibrio sp.]|uniref:VOC family protein n=1 Tax=Marivibrio sp. TaxID=2039719 RepID=UPI0032F08565
MTLKHLNLPVGDIERSLDFYVRKLGFAYVRHLNERKVILNVGGFDFFLEEAPPLAVHPKFHFGVETSAEGVHAFARKLESLGVPQVVGPQPTGRAETYVTPDGVRTVLYFADPDEHVIEVYSHIGVDVGYVVPGWGA